MRGNELFLSFGVMGGFMQPQGHVQVLLNILRGFNVQAALDAPRFCISAALLNVGREDDGSAGDINGEIYFEDSFPQHTINVLRGWSQLFTVTVDVMDITAMGHDARVVTGHNRGMMGRGQVIQKLHNPSGPLVWAAGSDPRGDGHAAPQI